MNHNLIRTLAEGGEGEQNLFILIAAIIFVLVVVLLFIYLASCIIIVKQGTRKIVERFGSYNRTLKEGIHIIFRPFDKIAPVPWNILSISERDEFEKNMARKRIPYYNDRGRASAKQTARGLASLERNRAELYKKLERDIRMLIREKQIDRGENVSAAYADSLDVNGIVERSTGRSINELINEILDAQNGLTALEESYRELGIDAYRANDMVINELIERNRERDALAASVKYYPRHQDKHSFRPGAYPMQENHVQDFVDLRERHIDTSNQKVRKLFALKLDSELHFPSVGLSKDAKLLSSSTRFSGVNLITKDNASIGANIVIFFSVTDPFLYYYGVDEPEESLVLLAITTLRNIVSGLTLEEALQARAQINKQIREELDIATNNWGIKANRVEVKEFELGYSMQKAMDDVLIAEREKRANILRAEGYRKMKDEQVMAEHIRLKGYETLEEVSRGSANKVFIPSDLSDFITGAHVVADAFKDGKKEEKPASPLVEVNVEKK